VSQAGRSGHAQIGRTAAAWRARTHQTNSRNVIFAGSLLNAVSAILSRCQ